jgi:uncharacterized protein YpmB
MREWIKPIIFVIVIVAVGIVVINDIGAVVFQALRADDIAQKIDAEAIRVFQQTNDERAAGLAAVAEGQRVGAEVYGYQYKDAKITVWIRLKPHRTIVLERFLRWAAPRYPKLKQTLDRITTVTSLATDSVR